MVAVVVLMPGCHTQTPPPALQEFPGWSESLADHVPFDGIVRPESAIAVAHWQESVSGPGYAAWVRLEFPTSEAAEEFGKQLCSVSSSSTGTSESASMFSQSSGHPPASLQPRLTSDSLMGAWRICFRPKDIGGYREWLISPSQRLVWGYGTD